MVLSIHRARLGPPPARCFLALRRGVRVPVSRTSHRGPERVAGYSLSKVRLPPDLHSSCIHRWVPSSRLVGDWWKGRCGRGHGRTSFRSTRAHISQRHGLSANAPRDARRGRRTLKTAGGIEKREVTNSSGCIGMLTQMTVRVTVRLPEDLLRRAKGRAKQDGRTLPP